MGSAKRPLGRLSDREMSFTVLHSIPDCAEGGQLAKSRERDGGRGENISVADIMVNSDRVRRWLGATMCRAAGLGRFTAPLATSRRWFCLPYTLVESGGLEPCRCSRPARDAAPTITPTIFCSDRLAADAGPGQRRSQLPQIRPEALDAPDFVGVGEKPARQDGQRGRRNGGGSPWAPGHLARPRPRWTT